MGTLIGAMTKEVLSYATLTFVVLPFIASLAGQPAMAGAGYGGLSLPTLPAIPGFAAAQQTITSSLHSFGGAATFGASGVFVGGGQPIFIPH